MPGSVFTSGIVNQTSELTYHYDAGNFHGAWSCMMALSYDTEGGNLVFPAYRIALSVEENRLFMFNGSELLHGVSHIKKRTSRAYRYSIVFYALEAMKHCLEPCEEVKRARQSDIVRARRTPEERLVALRSGRKG
jgi:hypothetical protein